MSRNPDLIVREFDHLADMGVHQVLLASDNFIGDEPWAEAVCDKVIEWRQRTGKSLSLYTWLTINVGRRPRLLRKLRMAGFDMFFIGVESFYQNSLLETAKVQEYCRRPPEHHSKDSVLRVRCGGGIDFWF